VIGPEAERARAGVDALTVAFGDLGAERYGLVRLGLAPAAGGERLASALVVLYAARELATVAARGGLPVGADADWADLEVAGLRSTVEDPLERWRVTFAGEDAALDLAIAGLAPPAAAGEAGYEQLCQVTGKVTLGGRSVAVNGPGQRGRRWEEPDWERVALTRTVSAWLEDGSAVALAAERPASVHHHAGETVWAALLGPGDPVEVSDSRLSTTYDGAGHQRRAGLELWVREADETPRRAAGEAICGATLELGALRLQSAFLRWHMEGRDGVGRYDVLRPA